MSDFDDNFYGDEGRSNFIPPNFEPPKYDGQNKDSYNYLTDTTDDYGNYDYGSNDYNQNDNGSNSDVNNRQDHSSSNGQNYDQRYNKSMGQSFNSDQYYTDTIYNTPNDRQQNYGGYNQNPSYNYNAPVQPRKNNTLLFVIIGFFVIAGIILIAASSSVLYSYFHKENSSSVRSGTSNDVNKTIETETNTYIMDVYDLNEAYSYIDTFDASGLEACLINGNFDIDYYDEENYSLLLYALMSENYEAMEILINAGANINLQDTYDYLESPLHYAIYNEDLEAVKLLVEHDANVNITNSSGATPFLYSLSCGREFVDVLLAAGADAATVDIYGWNALHYCAYYGEEELYDYLLELGVDENAVTLKGYNVAHAALCGTDNVVLVEKLIAKGYELSQPTTNGDTLLHIVNTPEMAEYVMANYECDYNVKNSDGDTPLHYATYNELGTDLIRIYLDNGANPNAQNTYGSTPLMYAVPDEGLVRLYLEYGADKTIMDKDGDTAFDYIALQEDLKQRQIKSLEELLNRDN